MTGVGQGKTQAADFWSTNPNWIFMPRCTQCHFRGKWSWKQHISAFHLWNFAFEFKREMFMGSWWTGQMNQIGICPIWGQNICERASLRLSGGYFYDYGLNALPGIACRGCHCLPTYSCVQGWSVFGANIIPGKSSFWGIYSQHMTW